jgi:hypothetical protein
MAKVQKRVEVRGNVGQPSRVAPWEDHDRHRITIGLRHPTEGIFRPWPVLHSEDTDALAGRDAAEAVRHVQAGTLLADDDGADIGDCGRLDDRIDGIADEHLYAFTLENFCDCCRTLHATVLP